MVNAQEYFDKYYPLEERKNITELNLDGTHNLKQTITELENKSHKTAEEQAQLINLKTQLAKQNSSATQANNHHLLYWSLGIIGVTSLLVLLSFLIIRKNKKSWN